jgi:hypothetical protein
MSHQQGKTITKVISTFGDEQDKWRVPSGRKGAPFRDAFFAAIKQPLVTAAR